MKRLLPVLAAFLIGVLTGVAVFHGGSGAVTGSVDYFERFSDLKTARRDQMIRALSAAGDEAGLQAMRDDLSCETRCELALSAYYTRCAVWVDDRGVFAAVYAGSLSEKQRQTLVRILCRESGRTPEALFLSVIPP